MLGFGGHFLTKSRRYSITFRENRITWRHTEATDVSNAHGEETILVISTLAYGHIPANAHVYAATVNRVAYRDGTGSVIVAASDDATAITVRQTTPC